jgi:hypothetical protein
MSMIALVLTLVAFILGINATWTCKYLQINGYINPPEYFSNTALYGRRGVGLLSYEAPSSDGGSWYCYGYTEDDIQQTPWLDASFKAAYSMAVIANVFLGVPMLMMLVIGCVRFHLLAIKGLAFMELLGSVCMMLTLVILNSALAKAPFYGNFYIGPGLAIAASVVGFVAGLVILKIPEARDDLADQPTPQAFQPGTVTTTETDMPDGTKKIVKTTVNPDGSQTVTETVIPA